MPNYRRLSELYKKEYYAARKKDENHLYKLMYGGYPGRLLSEQKAKPSNIL